MLAVGRDHSIFIFLALIREIEPKILHLVYIFVKLSWLLSGLNKSDGPRMGCYETQLTHELSGKIEKGIQDDPVLLQSGITNYLLE